MLFCEFYEIFKNILFMEYFQEIASKCSSQLGKKYL